MMLSFILALAMQAAHSSPVQIISREMMSQVEDPKEAVARTPAEWAALWRQHAGETKLAPVDFGSRMVVAVFLGTRSSAGYSADITGVREAGGTLIVQWQERRPEKGEVSAQVLTSPAVLASVPKFAGPIKFEKVSQ